MINLKLIEFNEYKHAALVPEITNMLHESYGELAKKGMNFLASHQTEEKTLQRLCGGKSYIGFMDNKSQERAS